MKIYIKLTFLISIGMLFTQCKEASIVPKTGMEVLYYQHPSDQIAIETAKSLAVALGDKNVRQFVKSHVLEEFDGDYNFLVGKYANSIVTNKSFSHILFGG